MARRKEPGHKEYNPLDDARVTLPIEHDLIHDVVAGPPRPTRAAEHALPNPGQPAEKGSTAGKLNAYNKFLTTPREKLELERLAAHVSGALGVSVKSSQLIRACLVLLLHAEGNLLQHAATLPPLRRPSNAEAVALAEFDQILAELLYHSFRDAAPPKAAQPTVS